MTVTFPYRTSTMCRTSRSTTEQLATAPRWSASSVLRTGKRDPRVWPRGCGAGRPESVFRHCVASQASLKLIDNSAKRTAEHRWFDQAQDGTHLGIVNTHAGYSMRTGGPMWPRLNSRAPAVQPNIHPPLPWPAAVDQGNNQPAFPNPIRPAALGSET